MVYGLLLMKVRDVVCVYTECNTCENVKCLKKAEFVLRRFRLRHRGVSRQHSVLFRFTDVEDCLRSAQALQISNIKAKIVFPVLG